jgi:hypothetical protein
MRTRTQLLQHTKTSNSALVDMISKIEFVGEMKEKVQKHLQEHGREAYFTDKTTIFKEKIVFYRHQQIILIRLLIY